MTDLVLVAIHLEPSPRAVPLGPAMLAAALNRAFGVTFRTQVLDLFLQDCAEACADRILAADPGWVGFSMYLWNRPLALAIAGELKRRKPGLVLFAGGAEATADLQGVLAHPAMDFVLCGEGEELIVEAMTLLREGCPPGDLQARLQPRPVADLATLASPFLDGTLDIPSYSGHLWELSRGCPFTCDFCFESRGDKGTRRIPMDRLQAELESFEAAQVSQIFVLDPTFNYQRDQAKEVLRRIRQTAPGIHFFFEIRSEFLDRELAELFASIKCTLQIGLQSARRDVLRNIGRSMDPGDFRRKILLLHEAGATYGFDLIYGLPGDTLEGFLGSLDFALGLMPNHLDIFRLSVLPGTRLRETAPGFQLEHQQENPYQVTGSPTFSGADLAEAERIARACDLFYNQGKAVPWFAIIQGALEIPPSEFFRRFADHLDRSAGQDPSADLGAFVAAQFAHERPEMGAVAADLVTYFSLAAALADAALHDAPARAAGTGRQLAPQARLAQFRHDPHGLLENLEAGITELEDLSYVVPAGPRMALLHWQDGCAAIRDLTPAQAARLQRLDAPPVPEDADLEPFLEALAAQGLLLSAPV